MAVRNLGTIHRFTGLSTDEKPGRFNARDPEHKIHVGSTFDEEDTGRRFRWNGDEWILRVQTIDAKLDRLIEVGEEANRILRATHSGHEEWSWEQTVEIDGD